MNRLLIISLFLLGVNTLDVSAQCTPEIIAEARRKVQEHVRKMNVNVVEQVVNEQERSYCACVNNISLQDFMLLNYHLESSRICTEKMPSNAECSFTELLDRENGVYCNHVFYRKLKSAPRHRNPTKAEINEIKYLEGQLQNKKERLRMLKQQQAYLTTDNLNLFGEILVAEIPNSSMKELDKLTNKAATQLKEYGINELSKYYEIDYKPSENETAELVRNIISPIDEFLGKYNIDTGKFCKYWEIMKLTPDLGMIIGNSAAKVRIYFMQKELEQEIADHEKRLNEIRNAIANGMSERDGMMLY